MYTRWQKLGLRMFWTTVLIACLIQWVTWAWSSASYLQTPNIEVQSIQPPLSSEIPL